MLDNLISLLFLFDAGLKDRTRITKGCWASLSKTGVLKVKNRDYRFHWVDNFWLKTVKLTGGNYCNWDIPWLENHKINKSSERKVLRSKHVPLTNSETTRMLKNRFQGL